MKVALFGFGKAGKRLCKELTNNRNVDSVHIFDPSLNYADLNSDSWSEIVKIEGRSDFLNSSFDLAVIASPDLTHFEYLVQAINLGVPSFVEKPYVGSVEQTAMIISLLAKAPRYRTTTNLLLRSAPLFRELRALYQDKSFGEKVYIEGKYLYGRWSKLEKGWRGYSEYSVTLGGLIHLIDLACFITNHFFYESKLSTVRLTSREPGLIRDFSHLSLFSNEIGFLNLSTSFSASISHRRDFSIFGDLGSVEVRGNGVWTSNNKLSYLEKLAPLPDWGSLLNEFILNLMFDTELALCPSREEVLGVLKLCLGINKG